jgi:hypothetical protein
VLSPSPSRAVGEIAPPLDPLCLKRIGLRPGIRAFYVHTPDRARKGNSCEVAPRYPANSPVTSRQSTLLRILLLITAVAAGSFIVIRRAGSPLNAEGIFALSILLVALLPRTNLSPNPVYATVSARFQIPAVLLIAALAFVPAIQSPLLHDAYVHVWSARIQSWTDLLQASLVHPRPGDLFFRPIGYLSYWLDYKWADSDPVRWNLWNIALHLLNTALVWKLARKLCCGVWGASIAALLFALHGTRPETVAWVGARFDLLATFFSLAALLGVIRYIDTGAIRWCAAGCVCAFAAFLSKESSYSLFLLVLLVMPFRDASYRPGIVRSAVGVLIVCALVFAARTYFLHGVGGYTTTTGAPAVLQFSLLRTVKALLFRQWAILFFPVNWSTSGLLLKITLPIALIAAALLAIYSSANRKLLAASLLWVIAAVLPAQHMLLIGQDLSGSRILYLPAIGFALFWALLAERSSPLLPIGLLLFQLAALEHNLKIWRDVALLSNRTCIAVGAGLRSDSRDIVVSELPNSLRGVYFLRNGFPQCVAITTGQSIDRIMVAEDNPQHAPDARFYKWNGQREAFEPVAH